MSGHDVLFTRALSDLRYLTQNFTLEKLIEGAWIPMAFCSEQQPLVRTAAAVGGQVRIRTFGRRVVFEATEKPECFMSELEPFEEFHDEEPNEQHS